METTKKKKKIEEPTTTEASTTTVATLAGDASSFRNWLYLPEDLLLPIFHHLSFSLPDRLAFSAVCRSWRSLATATPSPGFCVPPLFLTPVLTPPRSGPHRWSRPARCRLRTLTNKNRSYRCMISSKTLRKSCVGSSFGQLIFIAGKKVVLSDVLTGQDICSPNLPSHYQKFSFIYGLLKEFKFGTLTAPLHSPSCLLILVSSFNNILCWQRGSTEWSELKLGNFVDGRIVSLAVVKGQIFVLDSYPSSFPNLILVKKFSPYVAWRRVQLPLPDGTFTHDTKCSKHLVECGGELLFVLFAATGENLVYWLDLPNSSWVRMESLGNWCLFVHTKQVLSCPNPMRWGGQSNCVYYIRPGFDTDTWTMVPFDGGVIETTGDFPFSNETSTLKLFPWPSPIWVYPSMLFENHTEST